jgi:hypothetical protein
MILSEPFPADVEEQVRDTESRDHFAAEFELLIHDETLARQYANRMVNLCVRIRERAGFTLKMEIDTDRSMEAWVEEFDSLSGGINGHVQSLANYGYEAVEAAFRLGADMMNRNRGVWLQ